jgi:hypothetical protein
LRNLFASFWFRDAFRDAFQKSFSQKSNQKKVLHTSLLFLPASSMSPPTLMYFDATGRANLARLAFVAGGVEFIDQRVGNWPEIKGDPTSVPSQLFGQLPCIEHDVLCSESPWL